MNPININEDFRLYRHDLDAKTELTNLPFDGENYCCLVVFADNSLSGDDRALLADRLIESSCRVIHAWGHGCVPFTYVADQQTIKHYPNDTDRDANWVMATSHHDSIAEALWDFINCSEYSDVAMRNFLIVYSGENPTLDTELSGAIRNYLDECDTFWKEMGDDMKSKYLERSRNRDYRKSK